MHPEDIKAQIRKRGTTPAQIARDLAVSQSAVSLVIAGTAVSARIRERISLVTGLPVSALWPSHSTRYLARRAA